MFTIPTLPKILLIVAVIAAVWWFFRRAESRNRSVGGDRPKSTAKNQGKQIEDMVQCPKCGAYVPAGSAHCGKDGCPY